MEKPIPHYIDNPYPVEVPVPVPVHEPYYIPVELAKPYPVQITAYLPKPYAVPQPYPVPVPQPIEVPVQHAVPMEVKIQQSSDFSKQMSRLVERYPANFGKGNRANKPVDPYAYASSYSPSKVPCNDQTGKRPNNLQGSPSLQNYQIKNPPLKSTKYTSTSYQNVQHQAYNTIPHQFQVHHQPQKQYFGSQGNKNQLTKPHPSFYSNQYLGLFPPKLESHPTPKSVRRHRNARHNFESNIRMEYGFMPPLRPSLEIDENGQPIEGNS